MNKIDFVEESLGVKEGAMTVQLSQFEPFKLVVEAYATSEFAEGPEWAEVTITPEFLQTLERLRRLCQNEGLESVTVHERPDIWDQEDELRIHGDSLRVWGNDFWFEAQPKHRDYGVETRMIGIDDLIKVARTLATGGTEARLPEGFTVKAGVVFYGSCGREEPIEDAFEAEEEA